MEELKKELNYKAFTQKDRGYFVTFEHENEASELLSKKGCQSVFAQLLNERDFKVPYFISFQTID